MTNSPTLETKDLAPDMDIDSTEPPQTLHRNASWGAIISITIILAMVIIGAFYSWGQRISENRAAEAQMQGN